MPFKIRRYIALSAMLTLLLVASVGCSRNERSTTQASVSRTSYSSTTEESWEYKLALLNKGAYVSPSDPTVRQFRKLLDRITSKSGLSEKRVAEMTFGHHDLLKREGDRITLLRFMDECCKTWEVGTQLGVSYEEILTTVVVMVRNG